MKFAILTLMALTTYSSAFDKVESIVPKFPESTTSKGLYGAKIRFEYRNLKLRKFDKSTDYTVVEKDVYLELFKTFCAGCLNKDFESLIKISPAGFFDNPAVKKQIEVFSHAEEFYLHGVAKKHDKVFFIAGVRLGEKILPLFFGIDNTDATTLKMKVVTIPDEFNGLSLLVSRFGDEDLPIANAE